jgi:hypothetical protein
VVWRVSCILAGVLLAYTVNLVLIVTLLGKHPVVGRDLGDE